MTYFRNSSTRRSRCKAGLCHCTLGTVSIRAEPTFVLLRYSLGGDRPSQTTQLPLFLARITGIEVRPQTCSGWYFTVGSFPAGTGTSKPPTYPTQNMLVANTSL